MENLTSKISLLIICIFLSACTHDGQYLKKALKQYHNQDFKNALLNFEKSCLQGQIYACKMTASLYQEGKTTEKSKAKALKALEYACKWGDTFSCNIALRSYQQLKLYSTAIKMIEYACQGGDARACTKFALYHYKNNTLPASLEFSSKACYGGDIYGCELYLAIGESQLDSQKLESIKKQVKKLNPQLKN